MTAISNDELRRFMIESNAIEGITRSPPRLTREIKATGVFLDLAEPMVMDIVKLVSVYQPDAQLRTRQGMNVRVGKHIAPPGGRDIRKDLEEILYAATEQESNPHYFHCWYEELHPFTDGNGRSGRTLWLWMMLRRGGAPLGFLHTFYYQALAAHQ